MALVSSMKIKHPIVTVISRGDQADIGIIKEILTDYVTITDIDLSIDKTL